MLAAPSSGTHAPMLLSGRCRRPGRCGFLAIVLRAHRPAVKELAALAKVARDAPYRARDFIFMEGDSALWFCLVKSGRVRIVRQSRSGKDVVLELLGPGEPFGGVAMIEKRPYPASAQATEPSVITETDLLRALAATLTDPLTPEGGARAGAPSREATRAAPASSGRDGRHAILVPLDGSPGSESVLPTVGELALAQGARVRLLRVAPEAKAVEADDRIIAYADQETSRVEMETLAISSARRWPCRGSRSTAWSASAKPRTRSSRKHRPPASISSPWPPIGGVAWPGRSGAAWPRRSSAHRPFR